MTEVKKTTIRPNVAGMTKTAGGSYHKPDFIGQTLAGLSVAQVLVIAVAVGLSADKYKHLNPGQQRMTLGNQLRKMTNILEVPEVDGKPDQKVCDKNEEIAALRDKITDMAKEALEANEDEKVAKLEAKKAAKDAAAKAKAEAPKAEANEAAEV